MCKTKQTTDYFYNKHFFNSVIVVLFVALLTLLIKPLSDIDLWWHLATGRYIFESKSLLEFDPFGLAGNVITPGREIILNSYWLGQIIFYHIYNFAGEPGLIFLRAMLLLLPPFTIFAYCRRRKINPAIIILLTALTGGGMLQVAGLRPNHITVAFVPLLFVLIETLGYTSEFKPGETYNKKPLILFPVLMLIWANLHGGFILGIVVLALYTICESITVLLKKKPFFPIIPLWAITILSILLTFLSPHGIDIYFQVLPSSDTILKQKTSEYLSPFFLASKGALIYWAYFVSIAGAFLVILARRFRIPATRLVLICFLLAISTTAFRYAPLFVGAIGILLASEYNRLLCITKPTKVFGVALLVYICILAITSFPTTIGAASKNPVSKFKVPASAVDFVIKNGWTGVVFNHFNWGGYLAWRAPQKLIPFIDGRSLNMQLFHAYTRTLWLPDETQSILDKYNVNIIIMPRLNPDTGELYALTDFLYNSESWSFVYRDDTSMIFIRKNIFPNVKQLLLAKRSLIYRDVLTDVERLTLKFGSNLNLHKAGNFASYRLREKIN